MNIERSPAEHRQQCSSASTSEPRIRSRAEAHRRIFYALGAALGVLSGCSDEPPVARQSSPLAADGTDPARLGQWSPVQSWFNNANKPFGAIHAALLANGKVLAWTRRDAGGVGSEPQVVLWTPPDFPSNEGTFSGTVPTPADDLFCVGQNAAPDGRLLTFGGHIDGGKGINAVNVYDPYTEAWTKQPHDMNAARWYPTSTTLGNGETIVLGGTVNGGSLSNDVPQIYRGPSGFHTLDNPEALLEESYYYPWLFARSDGRVFFAGPLQRTRTLAINTTAVPWTGAWTTGIDTNAGLRDFGSAVMYRPDRILIVGGGGDPNVPLTGKDTTVKGSAEVIDLSVTDTANPPSWRYTRQGGTGDITSLAHGRRQHNATILPNGQVLITGGCSGAGFLDEDSPVRAAELWDPATEAFTTMASFSSTTRRIYHSLALLLPDGRVLSAGGGYYANGADPLDANHFPNAEIYAPPYLFNADGSAATRPTITSVATSNVAHGGAVSIETPDSAAISRVTLVRLGAVTHSFNNDQRFSDLSFSVRGPTTLAATLPTNVHTSPPGHYMLFLLNAGGVPSTARIVSLGSNLITDSGFESQTTAGEFSTPWSAHGEGAIGVETAVDTASTGSKAGAVTHAAGTSTLGTIRQSNIAVEGSTTYTVSAWINTSNNWSQNGVLAVRDQADALLTGTGDLLQSQVALTNGSGYRQVALTFTTASSTTSVSLVAGAWGSASAATWLRVDDVAIVKDPNQAAAASVTNRTLVTNADFEQAQTDPASTVWVAEGTGTAGVATTAGNAFIGTGYGYQRHAAGETSWGNLRQYGIPIQPNSSYTLTAWLLTSGNWQSSGWLSVRDGANALMTGNGRGGTSEVDIPGTSSWRRLSVTFASGSATTVSVIAGSSGRSDEETWLRMDDVILTKNP
jgi:hypothetical protein